MTKKHRLKKPEKKLKNRDRDLRATAEALSLQTEIEFYKRRLKVYQSEEAIRKRKPHYIT